MTPEERDLSFVPRWAIVRTIRRQTVDQHCYWVARLVAEIAPMMGLTRTSNLLQYALVHDDYEKHSGDMPSPFKKKMGIIDVKPDRLSDAEFECVKIADVVEAAIFLIEEERLGNMSVGVVKRAILENIVEMAAGYSGLGEYLKEMLGGHMVYTGRLE